MQERNRINEQNTWQHVNSKRRKVNPLSIDVMIGSNYHVWWITNGCTTPTNI